MQALGPLLRLLEGDQEEQQLGGAKEGPGVWKEEAWARQAGKKELQVALGGGQKGTPGSVERIRKNPGPRRVSHEGFGAWQGGSQGSAGRSKRSPGPCRENREESRAMLGHREEPQAVLGGWAGTPLPEASQPEVQPGGGSYLCRPLSMKHTSPQLLSPSSGSISLHTAASMVPATGSGC